MRLSQLFLIENSNMDANYMAAIEKNDMDAVSKMVEQSAHQSGYVVGPVWHGTPDGRFLKSDPVFKSIHERYGKTGMGVHWFAKSKSAASTYAQNKRAFDFQEAIPEVISAYLKIEKPLEIQGGGSGWRTAQKRGQTSDAIEKAIEGKNDGIVIHNVRDEYENFGPSKPTTTYAVFSSNAIKLADPITYEKDGTIIPLSRRFDSSNPDIRY